MVLGEVGVNSPATRAVAGTGFRAVTPVVDDSDRGIDFVELGATAEADKGVLKI